MDDQLLNVAEVAVQLGTKERFVRRLIAERRIAYVKVGAHVRISQAVVTEYIRQSTVEPLQVRWSAGRAVA